MFLCVSLPSFLFSLFLVSLLFSTPPIRETHEQGQKEPAEYVEKPADPVRKSKKSSKKSKKTVLIMSVILLVLIVGAILIKALSGGMSYEEPTLTYESDNGIISYAGTEKADPKLTDEEQAYVVKFDFTNSQGDMKMGQEIFGVTLSQNGEELTERPAWNSSAEKQYELCSNLFVEVGKGDTISYAYLVKLNDDSPLTITVKDHYGDEADAKSIDVKIKAIDKQAKDE